MTQTDNDLSTAARRQFAAALTAGRVSDWRSAFASVPRHVFVPRFHRQDATGTWQALTVGDPGYLETVYSDVALTTQLDDRGVPTSSSSQPSIMLAMLDALNTEEGHRVFELGTGTGYNLALLAHRLGEANVTSVDVDTDLVTAAARHLAVAGFAPTVAVGDGAQGYPSHAPFDRIIATVGLHALPQPLMRQTTPGAVFVVPLGYGIVRATVTAPGHATGRFLPTPAHFMARRTAPVAPQFDAALQQTPTTGSVSPQDLLGRLKFPASIALPGYTSCTWRTDDGKIDAVGLWTSDGSTAIAHESGAVRQTGRQRLWDTVEDLAKTISGEPDRSDFLLTVTPTRQSVSYGDTDGPSWSLPTTI